ncbi:hypothetical protein AB205_0142830, partial [Aquarana catesbeiana]
MIKSIRMEEDWSHMTERILNLTLEIIYLLTGERFPLLKSGDHMTITVPPCDSLKPERHNMQKILEVTKKMMELLTGESGNLRDSKVEVKKEIKVEDDEDGVMGKSEILKKHKDLYQDTMVESSSNRNPPERCLHPLDSTQEGHRIPQHHQSGNLRDCKVDVKEEIKEEDEDGVMEDSEFLNKHKNMYWENMVESPSYKNPPERCPRPLYSRDSKQEGHTIPHHHQIGNLRDSKVEVKVEEEEMYVGNDHQSMEEDGIIRLIIEEDTPTEISK